MSKSKRIRISYFGYFLQCLEIFFISNIKRFISRHEKTVEVCFLTIYVGLQAILIYFKEVPVTIIVISFLFFLSLERIFVHIWLDSERKILVRKEKNIRNILSHSRILSSNEISRLEGKIEELKKIKLKNKR